MAKKQKTSLKLTKNGIKISGPDVDIETDGSIRRNALEAGLLIADSRSGETRAVEPKEKKVVVAGAEKDGESPA